MPVLKIKKDGVWETIAGGGSSTDNLFIVEIDVDNETASHTPSEIAAAKEAGKFVIGKGKSSLLFDGTFFNLFDANETRAVFEYTRSTFANVNTYKYEIDVDKKATLSTYQLYIGNLNDLNTTNKESIVDAINEVAASAGGSGTDLPVYTESDYGKVLSVTADGLVWVEQDTLTDLSEVAF